MATVLDHTAFGQMAAHVDRAPDKAIGVTATGPGLWNRLLTAMTEARARRAEREIARHQPFVSDTQRFMEGVRADSLPFGS